MLNDGFPRVILVPVTGSIATIRQHLSEHPEDTKPDEEETREMLQIAIDFLKTAPLLELYAKALSGESAKN